VVEAKEIRILERIEFETGKATLRSESIPVLEGVQRALGEHPEIRKVKVEGHTDNRGPDAFNLRLSRNRAKAVVAWLVEHGVASDRLISEGFGETRPLESNGTEDGRQRNRRVQFMIEEKAGKAPAP
jgi:outer membrane protein OmpA-like peptidoglycan-associated protein